MRYAIFSDIHANLRAWEQVLADIGEQGADVLLCLGDVVGYGPKPEEVLNAIRGVTDNFVMGNHDAAAAGAIETSYFNEHARGAIEWTIAALSDEARAFLGEVPLAIEAENILFVHAEICEPGRFGYIEEVADAYENFAGSDHFVTFVGHTHYPCVFELSNDGSVVEHPDENRQLHAENRYIVNVGSVGEPRNPEDLRGRYAIYDSETREVEFRGVTFDISAYRADLESTDLSIKPYFLQVFDHLLDEAGMPVESAARAIDMNIAEDAAPLIQKRRGPAKLNIPATPMTGGSFSGYARPETEEVPKKNRIVLLVAIGAMFALVIGLAAFFLSGGDTKAVTVVESGPPVSDAPLEPAPAPSDPDPEPQPQPVPSPEPPAAAVIAEPLGPVATIDFNLSAGDNQSGTPLNVDGLTLEGQEGVWRDLQIGARPDTNTKMELRIDTGEGVFTFNPGGAAAFRAIVGGGDELRRDGVLVNVEAPGPIEWKLTGLTPRAGYDLILFAQADNGVRGNPADFTIAGHNDGKPAALDLDNDANFVKVIAGAQGEIHGTFALRPGEAYSAWAGLQFRKTSEPMVAVAPPAPKPAKAERESDRKSDIVFDDFEQPGYSGWKITGEAFGQGPVAIVEIPAYQNDVNGIGERVVNSHASAPGPSLGEKDNATGSLLSRPFKIERNFIAFRIGGGMHGISLQGGETPGVDEVAGTGVHLIVDGRAVRSLTGHNDNRMRLDRMDVSALRGKTGQLMIVDAVSGPWGNIGVDQIVFTDETTKAEPGPNTQAKNDPTVAWWRMDADSAGVALVDAKGKHALPALTSGAAIGGLAPSPIPFNKIENSAALSIGVWAEPAPAGVFALRADRSFTIEGWVVTARPRGPIFLAGTRSGDVNDSQGWHVDIRPNGQMAFFYDNGPAFVQALGEDVAVVDLKPHHFAAVWDHDAAAAAGEMRFYFEGNQVASTRVPHAQIPAKQANPFRIGAPSNPPKIGLDEVRFSHAALGPLEFLRAEPQRMVKNGKWADAPNWSGGAPPSGTQTAVIGAGVAGRVEAPTKFAGDLVLESKSTLTLATPPSKAVLPAPPSKLELNAGAQLILLMPRDGNVDFKRIEMAGAATIWGGRSTSGHHTNHRFTGEVSGPGALVLNGVNNNEFILQAANTFRGDFVAKSTQNQGLRVRAKAAGCLGSRAVKINPHATLILDAAGATSERNNLHLTGVKDNRSATKLIVNANNTVGEFFIDGKKQAAGTWGAAGLDVDHEHAEISGGGILTVIR